MQTSLKFIKMSELNVRWAFNASKWQPTVEDMLRCTTCIQPEEKERIGRFYFRNDFKSSLIGRLMMRKFVAESSNIEYNKIVFSRDDRGKPILLNPNTKTIEFNVSHQGDFVVFAGSNNFPIGVDVMKMEYKGGKELSEYFRIMNRQFSSEEWGNIKLGNDTEQIRTFYRNWCLKESYVKAVGVGITVNLQNISFKIVTKNLELGKIVTDSLLYINGIQQTWKFQETLLDENHCVAVATNCSNSEKIYFKELTIEDLLHESKAIIEEDLEYCNNYFKKPVK